MPARKKTAGEAASAALRVAIDLYDRHGDALTDEERRDLEVATNTLRAISDRLYLAENGA